MPQALQRTRRHAGSIHSRSTFAAILLVAVAVAGAGGAVFHAQVPPPAPPPTTAPELDTWLPRLDRVASLYRETAMSFACTELISWIDRNGVAQRSRFEYVYTVDDQQQLRDYRMDPSLRGDLAAKHEISPADYGVPRYVENGFSWIALFRRTRWRDHRYEFLGEGQVLRRPAVGIGFHPIPPYRKGVNEWEGEAWFDRETAQILRVEARRPDDFLSGSGQLATIGDEPWLREKIRSDFTVAKNGMRFPSLIRLDRYRGEEGKGTGSDVPLYRVEQAYRNYRFFEVRSAVEIRRIVFGD